MAADASHTEFLFSYGTLQLEAVQMATFGRLAWYPTVSGIVLLESR